MTGLAPHVLQPGSTYGDEFEYGLGLILDASRYSRAPLNHCTRLSGSSGNHLDHPGGWVYDRRVVRRCRV